MPQSVENRIQQCLGELMLGNMQASYTAEQAQEENKQLRQKIAQYEQQRKDAVEQSPNRIDALLEDPTDAQPHEVAALARAVSKLSSDDYG